jgi:hypothetical protein
MFCWFFWLWFVCCGHCGLFYKNWIQFSVKKSFTKIADYHIFFSNSLFFSIYPKENWSLLWLWHFWKISFKSLLIFLQYTPLSSVGLLKTIYNLRILKHSPHKNTPLQLNFFFHFHLQKKWFFFFSLISSYYALQN